VCHLGSAVLTESYIYPTASKSFEIYCSDKVCIMRGYNLMNRRLALCR